MIKKIKRAFVLGMTALVLFTGMPAPKVLAADSAPMHTKVSVSGPGSNQKVTYRLTIDKTRVTDGRIIVEYDPEVLTLVKAYDANGRFSSKDINTEYSKEGSMGVAYAFASDAPKTINGHVLAIDFTTKNGPKNFDTTVKTTILGLNNEDAEVMKDVTMEDTISVGRPLPQTPTGLTLGQSLVAFIPSWKKAEYADGYVVYRSQSKDGEYEEIGETAVTWFYDMKIKNNTTYYYKVASYQKNGDERIVSEPSAPVSGKIKKFFGWFG